MEETDTTAERRNKVLVDNGYAPYAVHHYNYGPNLDFVLVTDKYVKTELGWAVVVEYHHLNQN